MLACIATLHLRHKSGDGVRGAVRGVGEHGAELLPHRCASLRGQRADVLCQQVLESRLRAAGGLHHHPIASVCV